jgi:hypothetical protein
VCAGWLKHSFYDMDTMDLATGMQATNLALSL